MNPDNDISNDQVQAGQRSSDAVNPSTAPLQPPQYIVGSALNAPAKVLSTKIYIAAGALGVLLILSLGIFLYSVISQRSYSVDISQESSLPVETKDEEKNPVADQDDEIKASEQFSEPTTPEPATTEKSQPSTSSSGETPLDTCNTGSFSQYICHHVRPSGAGQTNYYVLFHKDADWTTLADTQPILYSELAQMQIRINPTTKEISTCPVPDTFEWEYHGKRQLGCYSLNENDNSYWSTVTTNGTIYRISLIGANPIDLKLVKTIYNSLSIIK